ncbi:MAG: hypothetical protein ABSA34_01440, partial [Candidatus Goldiibacteriota bacterium]
GRSYRITWRHSLNPLRKWSDQSRRWLDTSLGVGVLLGSLNISYTFQPLGDLGNVQRISTDIDF